MTSPAHRKPEAPVRVLAVDDGAAFRKAAADMIAHTAGFEVAGESTDGESAVRLACELDPDLILLDVRMDGIDGIETARRLTEESPTRLVVLVSSGDVRRLSEPAARAGAAAIMRKHWLSPRVLRGLWMALRRR
jgi:DNA-binding NarL/FixJ family response regulator